MSANKPTIEESLAALEAAMTDMAKAEAIASDPAKKKCLAHLRVRKADPDESPAVAPEPAPMKKACGTLVKAKLKKCGEITTVAKSDVQPQDVQTPAIPAPAPNAIG